MTEQTAGPTSSPRVVGGYPLVLDRMFDPETHAWAKRSGPGRVRIGMDSLGVETSGTLAQLSLLPVGTWVDRHQPLGQLEAAKFVGPLSSPLSGTIAAVNDAVLADPGLVESDPYEAGWLVELDLAGADAGLDRLLADPDQVMAWFTAEVADYRAKGVVAE